MTTPDNWLDRLRGDLSKRRDDHLLRALHPVEHDGPIIRIDGRELINLASNDYLGLSQHPHVKEAAIAAVEQFGAGAGASRLVSGSLTIHQRVERRFAEFKHAQAALLAPTGYMANLAAVTALAGADDLICMDKLNHASLIDAAALSGAHVRTFPHLNHDKLERLLSRDIDGQRFIITDAVFSMDGDVADLPKLCDLAERYDAVMIVDEAHATGVLGESGAGLCELQGVAHRVDVVICTASKALGCLGGIVTAKQQVIDTLINRARSFIYTTAATAMQAAALDAALNVVRDEPWRRNRVMELAKRVNPDSASPIIPIIVGDADAALALSKHLRDHGFFVPAIRPPTVAPGAARVRLSLRADLDDQHVEQLIQVLAARPVTTALR